MKRKNFYFLIAPALFLTIFLILPLASIVKEAFYSAEDPLLFFRAVLGKHATLEYLFNSLNIALIATILSTAIACPLALLMTRYEFRGRTILQILLLLPMIIPPFVGALGLRKIFSRFGPLNLILMQLGFIHEPIDWLGSGGLYAVAITEALHLYPIMYLNLQASLMHFDRNLEDAAASFGASPFQILRRIVLPMLIPGFYAGASITFIWAFTDLGTPLVFDFREVVPTQIFNLIDEIHNNHSGYALISVVMLITVLFFLASKLVLRQGYFASASKGSRMVYTRHRLSAPKTALAILLVGILLCVAALPHFGVLLVSISDKWFMSFLPQSITLKAYQELTTHPLVQIGIKNSLGLSALSTMLDLVLGLWIAWLMVRAKVGQVLLDVLTMIPLAVPGIVLAFGYLGMFSQTMLDPRVNPVPLLVIGYAIRRLPFMVRTLHSGLLASSVTLEEAAQNVGASPLQTARFITAPLLMPHLMAGAILCFTFAMLEVSESLILASQEHFFPLTKVMYSLLVRPDGPIIASALGVISMLLVALALWIASRLTRHGISWAER